MLFLYCIYNIFNNTINGYRIVSEDVDREKVREEMRNRMFALNEDGNILIDRMIKNNTFYEKDLANFCSEVSKLYINMQKFEEMTSEKE